MDEAEVLAELERAYVQRAGFWANVAEALAGLAHPPRPLVYDPAALLRLAESDPAGACTLLRRTSGMLRIPGSVDELRAVVRGWTPGCVDAGGHFVAAAHAASPLAEGGVLEVATCKDCLQPVWRSNPDGSAEACSAWAEIWPNDITTPVEADPAAGGDRPWQPPVPSTGRPDSSSRSEENG